MHRHWHGGYTGLVDSIEIYQWLLFLYGTIAAFYPTKICVKCFAAFESSSFSTVSQRINYFATDAI